MLSLVTGVGYPLFFWNQIGFLSAASAGAHTLSTMHSATRAESSLWVRVVCFIRNSSFLLTGGGMRPP